MIADESVSNLYIRKESSAKARQFLIINWMLFGFFLCNSYKSVLRATLVSVEYEKPIDTLEDLLKTDKPIIGYPTIAYFLKVDPRPKMEELGRKVDFENWSIDGRQEITTKYDVQG